MVKIEVQTQHVNVLRALHGFGEEDYSSGRTLPAGLSNRNGGLCAKNIRKSQQNSRRTAEGLNCQVFWGEKGEVLADTVDCQRLRLPVGLLKPG